MRHPQSANRFQVAWLSALVVVFAFHVGTSTVGWENRNLPGLEFRQAQTAISALFIQKENNFSLAYPTPVLGKPWSIPMEFPLYQWTVAAVSDLTGASLTKTARGVSIACFYLTLPAIAIFLRHLGLTPAQISMALICVLSCPLYIFYGRAFLIETMALMFAVWFAVGFHQTLTQRKYGWAVVTSLCAACAGMVKVTTLIVFLIPTAAWGAARLISAVRRRDRSLVIATLGWGLLPMVLPAILTVAWTRFADSVKSDHPQASVLMSDSMTQFNFGYGLFDVRFKPDTWQGIFAIIDNGILALPALGLVILAVIFMSSRWRRHSLAALGLFFAAPLIFPLLYSWHDYYFVANAVCLMLALGFVLAAFWETRLGRIGAPLLLLGLLTTQAFTYFGNYYEQQSLQGASGPKLSFTLKEITNPDEVVVILGDDWNPMIPFFAERRALMIRREFENDHPLIRRCLQNLHDEKVGALVLMRDQLINPGAVNVAKEEIGVSPHHFFAEDGARIYPARRLLDSILTPELRSREDASPLDMALVSMSHRLADKPARLESLSERDRETFSLIDPKPDQIYFQFGPGLIPHGDEMVLNAHTQTKLWFENLGKARSMTISGGLFSGAWQHETYPSDGVSVQVMRMQSGGQETMIHQQDIQPHLHPNERGTLTWKVELPDMQNSTLLVQVGPGPGGSGSTDWFYFEKITIE